MATTLILLGPLALVLGAIVLVRGHLDALRLRSRKSGLYVIGGGLIAFIVGGALTPPLPPTTAQSQTLVAPSTSRLPATSSPKPTLITPSAITPTTPKPVPSTSVVATPAAAPPTAPTQTFAGIGATLAYWNAHHTPDVRFEPNSSYDPNPIYEQGGDSTRIDHYYDAIWTTESPRLQGIEVRFASGTTTGEAVSELLATLLPDDAVASKPHLESTCAGVIVSSKKLGRLWHGPGADGSYVMLSLSSGSAADHYDPRAISSALVLDSMALPTTCE